MRQCQVEVQGLTNRKQNYLTFLVICDKVATVKMALKKVQKIMKFWSKIISDFKLLWWKNNLKPTYLI